ncbi:hypothetical protein [Pseudomonas nitroreducens]|uniref:hypothetical protein n=1 Tax=Pseudomonas nitroreducens TaxID=46680 RepID=UPI003B97198A
MLLIWLFAFGLARGVVYRLHTRLSDLPLEDLGAIHYGGGSAACCSTWCPGWRCACFLNRCATAATS